MINLLESINVQTASPLDSRTVVKTILERNAIPKTVRYLGMQVYVSDEKKRYELKNGTDDSHWEEIKAVAKASELVTDNDHLTVSQTEKDTWNGKADGNHNHDSVYAKTSHKHNATDITQDTTHKFVTDTQISGWESKAAGDHNHDNTYAPKTHTHNVADIETDNNNLFVSIEEKDKWNLKADGDHNHDDKYSPLVHIHLASEINESETRKFITPEKLSLIDTMHSSLIKTITFKSGEAGSFANGKAEEVYKCLLNSDFPEFPEINPSFLNDFYGWEINPSVDILNDKVSRDVIITALYQTPTYQITFKCNEGGSFRETGTDTLVKYISRGEKIPVPEMIVPISYEFKNWIPELNEGSIATRNITYTANFNFLGLEVELDDSGKLLEKKVAKNNEYNYIEKENIFIINEENHIIID